MDEHLAPRQPPPPPPPRQQPTRQVRRRPSLFAAALGGLIGAGLTVAALAVAGVFAADTTPTFTVPAATPVVVEGGDTATLVSAIARQAIPSIVTVEVGFGDGLTAPAAASGSGVVYDDAGHIVTNNHVITDAEFVRVVYSDGTIYQAEVTGADPLTDLAVLHVAATGVPPIPLGNIDEVHIGDVAVAIGNPLGLNGGPSVTSGIVSAFDRRLDVTIDEELFGLLQTDAPITRGSSGGALLDGEGRLIGITTAIGVSDVGAEGLGFAVPVSIVEGVVRDLIAEGVVHHAFIGVKIEPAYEQVGDAQVPRGARILDFEGGTGVDRAGVKVGDIITAIDGRRVTGVNDLIATLRTHRAGDVIALSLLHDGEQRTVDVTLSERPEL